MKIEYFIKDMGILARGGFGFELSKSFRLEKMSLIN